MPIRDFGPMCDAFNWVSGLTMSAAWRRAKGTPLQPKQNMLEVDVARHACQPCVICPLPSLRQLVVVKNADSKAPAFV